MALSVKIGSYTGTGSALSISTVGFQPTVLLIKGGANIMQVGTVDMGTNKMQDINGVTPATGRLTSYDAGGFTLGTDAKVNANGTVYHYLALYDNDSSEMAHGTYAGNSSGPRNITAPNFQPTFVGIWDDIGDTGGYRTSDMPTDSYMTYDGSPALLTDRILALISTGFTVSFRNEVNGTGRNYYWFAIKDVASVFDTFTYTGNGSDDRNITSLSFQPDFALTNNASGVAAAVRFKDETGDNSYLATATGEAANRIQSFLSNGIQVGTDTSVNANTQVLYNIAFKGTTGASSQIKKLSGVTQATVKKVASVAIASVKKVIGVTNV